MCVCVGGGGVTLGTCGVCVRARTLARKRANVNGVRAYGPSRMKLFVRVCVCARARVRACAPACASARVRAQVRNCASGCVCAGVRRRPGGREAAGTMKGTEHEKQLKLNQVSVRACVRV